MGESPLRAISDAWREDAGFRAAVEEDAKAALASKGLEIHGPAEVSVAVDTEDVTHFVFPPDPNEALSDTVLDRVSGGTTYRSAAAAYMDSFARYGSGRNSFRSCATPGTD